MDKQLSEHRVTWVSRDGYSCFAARPANAVASARESAGDPATAALTATNAGASSVRTSYDSWGRVTGGVDATGNTSKTSYDDQSRPVSVDDGKATTTYTYDNPTEHRGLVTSETTGISGVGAITADYDPAGQPKTVAYPGGVSAAFGFNSNGSLLTKSYTDAAGASMLDWEQQYTGFGQIKTLKGPGSAGPRMQVFTYDDTGRLTNSDDTINGICTRRGYKFNNDSDRISYSITTAADKGCGSSTDTTTTSYTNTFDTADRQINTTKTGAATQNYTYDPFGRTLKTPGVDSGNRQTNTPTEFSYFLNDTLREQKTGTDSQTWVLDPVGRFQYWTTMKNGAQAQQGTNHYTGNSDTPAWTSLTQNSAQTWARYIPGPGGALAITQTGTTTTTTNITLNLTNPHGDITTTTQIPTNTTTNSSGGAKTGTKGGAKGGAKTGAKAGAKASAQAITPITDYDDYGTALTPAPTPYGWVGAAQKSNNTLNQFTIMGARIYNPNTGRFLTTDPIPGGNPNPYTYPVDPINNYDLTGTFSFGNFISSVVQAVTHPVQTIRAVVHVVQQAYHAVARVVKRVYHAVATAVSRVNNGARAAFAGAAHVGRVALGLARGPNVDLNASQTAKLARATTDATEVFGLATALTTAALFLGKASFGPYGLIVWGVELYLTADYGWGVTSAANKAVHDGNCSTFSLQYNLWASVRERQC